MRSRRGLTAAGPVLAWAAVGTSSALAQGGPGGPAAVGVVKVAEMPVLLSVAGLAPLVTADGALRRSAWLLFSRLREKMASRSEVG